MNKKEYKKQKQASDAARSARRERNAAKRARLGLGPGDALPSHAGADTIPNRKLRRAYGIRRTAHAGRKRRTTIPHPGTLTGGPSYFKPIYVGPRQPVHDSRGGSLEADR